MNVSGSLLLLLLTACMASAAVWEFGEVIRCYQPGVNPFKFNDYGCWCGIGGSGTPVDALDRCCHVHDMCYETEMTAHGCTHIYDLPYVLIYHYTCTNKQVVCAATNCKCQAAACNCDRAVAQCFAEYEAKYNPDNKDLNTKVHCAK